MIKKLCLRLPDELHARLVKVSRAKNESLNNLIIRLCEGIDCDAEEVEESRLETIEKRLASLEKEVFGKK